jgi:hypothetical protein
MPINEELGNLLMGLTGLTLIFFAVSSFFLVHLHDQVGKMKHTIQEMKNSQEIARDRVSYLYDQVSRVETKVDVKDTLEAIQEAIETSNG